MNVDAVPPVPPMPMASTTPGKVQAVAILTLISGITNILWMLILGITVSISTLGVGCLGFPFYVAPIVLGVFEILYAVKLLPEPIKPAKPSQTIAILEICCILTGNLIAVAAGIVALVMYSDPEVKAYFHAHQPVV